MKSTVSHAIALPHTHELLYHSFVSKSLWETHVSQIGKLNTERLGKEEGIGNQVEGSATIGGGITWYSMYALGGLTTTGAICGQRDMIRLSKAVVSMVSLNRMVANRT